MQSLSFVRRGRLRLLGRAVAAVAGLAFLPGVVASATPTAASAGGKPTIVLEHGAWVDGSSWRGVIERLQDRGFTVLAPPNELRGGKVDSTYLASFLHALSGPVVLVGHSYGGYVITNAAAGNPAVKALVYIDAFIPDAGKNVLAREAAVVAAVQRPIALHALVEPSGVPAWRTIPSWALVGTDDRVTTPAEQEFMATRANAHTVKVDAGHLSLITRPDAVTDLIVTAVNATS